MKDYVNLCLLGERSINERKNILAEKRNNLLSRINDLELSINFIDEKQSFYNDVLSGKTKYYSNLIDVNDID